MSQSKKSRRTRKASAPLLYPSEQRSWAKKLAYTLSEMAKQAKNAAGVPKANADTVARTLRGMGPDSPKVNSACGARMAVNMSSVHIPGFCSDGYKNTYDLANEAKDKGLKGSEAIRVSQRRKLVDEALKECTGVEPQQLYFGAVELTGAGIPFYGDICLILKPAAVSAETSILDRNSFDVDRSPCMERIGRLPVGEQGLARAKLLKSWAGAWGRNLAEMVTVRMHTMGFASGRRWTTGQVCRSIIDDEDYIEIAKVGGFNVHEIQEARLFAADVAIQAHISVCQQTGPTPSFTEMVWLHKRLNAQNALQNAGVKIRIVTRVGREKA